ncbi:MAG: tRNA pseudouridine(38-40) synthase TruA [Clostridia bacterium]|nr:tRNA pseudouridine(38-40) synthase TruA [Clostridia bacterium]
MQRKNYRLILAYDGTRYAGWQKQGNTGNTIQEKLEGLLTRLLGQPIEVAGSGRTDAGVHARAQVCSFKAETAMSDEALLREIRRYLPDDIGAVALQEAEPRFHARLSAREKTYLYRLWTSELPNVFDRKYTWICREPLELSAMRQAAQALCGTHDYTSFTSNRHMKKSAVRTLSSIRLEPGEQELRIWFTGNGFLYHMARILTGTLIEVGKGERRPEDVPAILDALDRRAAGFTAPAQGLTLWEVRYDDEAAAADRGQGRAPGALDG